MIVNTCGLQLKCNHNNVYCHKQTPQEIEVGGLAANGTFDCRAVHRLFEDQ